MNLIEVFIENGCKPCEEVTKTITHFANDRDIIVLVYERSADTEMFRARSVTICPATFIDGKLAFYGEFTVEQIQAQIEPIQKIAAKQETKPMDKNKPSLLRALRTLIAGLW